MRRFSDVLRALERAKLVRLEDVYKRQSLYRSASRVLISRTFWR